MEVKGSGRHEGIVLREVKVRKESSSFLLFILGGSVGVAVAAFGLEALRHPSGDPGVVHSRASEAMPAKAVARKAREGTVVAATTSKATAGKAKKGVAKSKGSVSGGSSAPSPSAPGGPGGPGAPASPATPGGAAPAKLGTSPADSDGHSLNFGPADSEHSRADTRALEEDMESALGGIVRGVWDDGETLIPRSLAFEDANAIAGEPRQAAGVVAAAVLDALGDEGVAVALEAPAAGSGRVLVAGAALETHGSSLVNLAEWLDGLPLATGAIQVELCPTEDGSVPVRLVGHLHPGITLEGALVPQVATDALARSPAINGAGLSREASARPVAFETETGVARRAYEITVPDPQGAHREIVDGETGAVLDSYPIACSGLAQIDTWERDPRGKRETQPLPTLVVTQSRKHAVTDADGNDSLTGDVTLPLGFDAPFVRVWPDGDTAFSYSGPADFTLLTGKGDASSIHQDEGAAFFYVTTYNAYFQETYPESAKAAQTRYALVVGSNMENAFFSPEQISSDDGESFPGYVDLGVIDGHSCARDSSVVRHEYTHSILNGVATLDGADEAVGINEGLADYFPCCFQEDPKLGVWLTPPYVRALDDKPRAYVYPDDLDGDPHKTGNILNQALWEARTQAEKSKAGARLAVDQAVWAGVLRFPETPALADARDAILAGDQAVNGGAYSDLLAAAFDKHGIAGTGASPGTSTKRKKSGSKGGSTASSGGVDFSEPRKLSYVLHPGETLTVDLSATSADGSRVVLSASTLRDAKLTKQAGATATGTWTFTPEESERGRQSVTLTATSSAGTVTKTLTVVVRQKRAS